MANPKDAPIGQGMARRAANQIEIERAYKKHVIEAQTNGEDPMSLDDFINKMKGDQQAENEAFRAEMKG